MCKRLRGAKKVMGTLEKKKKSMWRATPDLPPLKLKPAGKDLYKCGRWT